MIYNALNCQSARVFDVDTKREIKKVLEVDTLNNTVLAYIMPHQIVKGKLLTQTLHYSKIHPIYAGDPTPLLFHCYGRINENQINQ